MECIEYCVCFGGWQDVYCYCLIMLGCDMQFVVYLLLQVEVQLLLVLYWLSGLICIEQNFIIKVGVQCYVVEYGVIIVVLDISLCGDDVVDVEGYDFGKGVGFYFNVICVLWVKYYCMYDYVVQELLVLIEVNFLVIGVCVVSGYLMGGYGVLVIVLCNLGCYCSVLVFLLIVVFSYVLWGQKVFMVYLGDNLVDWVQWDMCVLLEVVSECLLLLVDQGEVDEFLQIQLQLQCLQEVCVVVGYLLILCLQFGYDYSYYFIVSFIGEYIVYYVCVLYV